MQSQCWSNSFLGSKGRRILTQPRKWDMAVHRVCNQNAECDGSKFSDVNSVTPAGKVEL